MTSGQPEAIATGKGEPKESRSARAARRLRWGEGEMTAHAGARTRSGAVAPKDTMPADLCPGSEGVPRLPKIEVRGAICAQWVRCGKPNCRCAKGQLHGPYYYRFWREGGKLRRAYVRKADAPAALAAYHTLRQSDRQRREEARLGRLLFQRMVRTLREVERHGRP